MKATEFDQKFDGGEDMTDHFDWSKATRPNAETSDENGKRKTGQQRK